MAPTRPGTGHSAAARADFAGRMRAGADASAGTRMTATCAFLWSANALPAGAYAIRSRSLTTLTVGSGSAEPWPCGFTNTLNEEIGMPAGHDRGGAAFAGDACSAAANANAQAPARRWSAIGIVRVDLTSGRGPHVSAAVS